MRGRVDIRRGAGSREAGFGLIEAIVACLILLIVGSALALAASGGSSLRGAARLQASFANTGKQVQEDLASNREWMAGCTAIDQPCDVRSSVQAESLALRDVEGAVTATATATPLDSELDGKAPNDADGVIPDYYRIRIVLSPDAGLVERFRIPASQLQRSFVTTVDRRGSTAFGSLAIELCRVVNQSDERMSVQGCANSEASAIRMDGCLAEPAPCQSVFNWVTSSSVTEDQPSPFVVMRRVNPQGLGIRVSGTAWSATAADAKLDQDGRLIFENVPAGTVRIDGIPDAAGYNTERWRSKELPTFLGSPSAAGGSIAIEPGVRARALAVYRPALTPRGVDLQFERRTRTHSLVGPRQGRNIVVAPWARTTTYEGERAGLLCDAINMYADGSVTCLPPRPGPGANCVTLMMQGLHPTPSSRGAWVTRGYGDWRRFSEDPVRYASFQRYNRTYYNRRAAVVCSEYWEEYITTYYTRAGTQAQIEEGIAQPANYAIEPMPAKRALDLRGGTVRTQIPQCVAQRMLECSAPSAPAPLSLQTLVPGLNAGLQTTPSVQYPNAGTVNVQRGVWPAAAAAAWNTLNSGALWVQPDGAIIGSNGDSIVAGTRITLRGEGECYWTSPRFAGRQEGSCNPCEPLWAPGQTASGCSLLTRVDWARHAREMTTVFNWPFSSVSTGPTASAMPSVNGAFDFDPPMRCIDSVPTVIGRCNPPSQTTSRVSVPATRHTGTGGTAEVRSHEINVSPGGV